MQWQHLRTNDTLRVTQTTQLPHADPPSGNAPLAAPAVNRHTDRHKHNKWLEDAGVHCRSGLADDLPGGNMETET
jgi:hypothetical protein